MVRRVERSAREILSEWRFWMIVAYLFLAFLVVGVVRAGSDSSKAQAKAAQAAAVRQADVSSSRKARAVAAKLKVSQCLAGIPQLRKINRFVMGVEKFHRILAANNLLLLKSTSRSDPQYQVRLRNYQRIAETVADVSGVRFHIPTKAECEALGTPR